MSANQADANVVNLLDRYKQSAHQSTLSTQGYQAWEVSASGTLASRFLLHDKGDALSSLSYPHLLESYSTSDDYVGLIFTYKVITLMGRHLTELVALLNEEKIAKLYCWDANRWPEPDAGVPIIIEVTHGASEEP